MTYTDRLRPDSTYKTGDVAMVTATNRSTEYRAHYDARQGLWIEHGRPDSQLISPLTIRLLLVVDPDGKRG